MQYFSTNKQSPEVDFKDATIQGQAPDKGLYYPAYVPRFSSSLLSTLPSLAKEDVAFEVMQPYTGNCLPPEVLHQIVSQTIAFDFPLVPVSPGISTLELFHGPTLAFKDVGARFMSRCLGYFNRGNDKKVTVLVATSGDTGGAVANGFEGVEGIEVIILYPSGKVSPVQELQLTTCGHNITALEIAGTFDDCQAMVKDAFLDTDLASRYQLTSANSINVARWLPQQLYYLFALQQWQHELPPVISVPSGNFGNICAGMMAWAAGLPVAHFIAACNANDVVPRFLATGEYKPAPAVATISNAMDVGNPSNFVRIMELFLHDRSALARMVSSTSISDDTTRATIAEVYQQHGYTLDPHGAVGYQALQTYLAERPWQQGFFLETAHPVKFPDVVEQAIGSAVPIPAEVQPLFSREKKSIPLPMGFAALKEWMLHRAH